MVQNAQQVNPLKQYFRAPKLFIGLPSGTTYYKNKEIEFTESGEVSVLAMTGTDELALKNPDGLLNGESLIEVIKSCVPAVKNPRSLLANDIDALITAIRFATYNDSLETEASCPSCKHDNTFKLDLGYALDNMEKLDPEYVVNLQTGLTVFVRPYSFPDVMKAMHADFERTKLTRAVESENLTDEQRSEIFKKAFKDLAVLKYDLLLSGIEKVVDESQNVNVADKKFIKELLLNLEKSEIDKINDEIVKINKIGIKKTFKAVCEKCKHEWETEIDFNPVNFS